MPPGVCRAGRKCASDSAGLLKWDLQWPTDWPTTDDFIDVGLPFGPKPRLVLYHLNAESLRTQSPLIELEDSLTAFVCRTLGLDPKGRNIRAVKEQLSRLAAADFRIGATQDGRAVIVKSTVIEGLEPWSPRDARRVLWPTTIQFSARYFESLMKHAVPLNEAAVARLSHSAMALDVYTWLANRLHRVDPNKPALPRPVACRNRRARCNIWKEGRFRIAQVKSLRLYEHDLANIRVMVVTRTHEKRSPTREG